jgi:hypothetical protein
VQSLSVYTRVVHAEQAAKSSKDIWICTGVWDRWAWIGLAAIFGERAQGAWWEPDENRKTRDGGMPFTGIATTERGAGNPPKKLNTRHVQIENLGLR